MKRLIASLSVILAGLPLLAAQAAVPGPGSLVTAPNTKAVYYLGSDGKRYVFPNEKTYFTWYDDFSAVVTITAQELGELPIGGNVTYRPGERMIKIQSDPRVYAVAKGGILRAVENEGVAEALYGPFWNTMIDDVPDAFFVNYVPGGPIDDASDYDASAERASAPTINQDKGLGALAGGPTIGPCPVFPANNPWNTAIDDAPLHPNSSAYIATMGPSKNLHPDFDGEAGYGIPFTTVDASQPDVPITFTDYGDESDPGPYPIPADAPIEMGSDSHVLVVDTGECVLYELFYASKNASGTGWSAASGAKFDLTSNDVRPKYWTSADAAGLPIFPGLVRYDEVAAGEIKHAIRFTTSPTQRGFIFPARHFASSNTSADVPPMGLRVRLKADYDISGYGPQARVILQALKTYGMILADNGSDWYITGAPDPRWNNDDINGLKNVPGSAFEAVYTGEIER